MGGRRGRDDAPTPFTVGQCVLVIALKRHGAIVDVRGQQYRVAVGGLTMTCRADELRAEAMTAAGGTGVGWKGEKGEKGKKARKAEDGAGREGAMGRDGGTSSIDLHGCTAEEAGTALMAHIDAALRVGDAVVEVVHGVGKGRVRAAVLDTLAGIPSVQRVHPHPTNRGVTRVYLS